MESYLLIFAGWTCSGLSNFLTNFTGKLSLYLPIIILCALLFLFIRPVREALFGLKWFLYPVVLLMVVPPIGVIGSFYFERTITGLECASLIVTPISTFTSDQSGDNLVLVRQKVLAYTMLWLLSVLVLTALILLRYNYQKAQKAKYQQHIDN